MIWNLAIANDVLQARKLVREHCCQKIFRFHPLQRRRDFCAATETRDGKRTGCVPSPANGEHRRVEQRLNKKRTNCFGIEITKHFVEREGMLRTERNHDGVIGCRRLQFEIERTAKPFSQR